MSYKQFLYMVLIDEGTIIGIILVAAGVLLADMGKRASASWKLVLLWLGRFSILLGAAAIISSCLTAAKITGL